MTKKERIVVICPGRGTYTHKELGYLKRRTARQQAFIESINALRTANQEPTISELDSSERFIASQHLAGEHASALIYTCAMADFLSLDPKRYDIVAVTGNSMGWYIALACAQALSITNAFKVINTMGSMMKGRIIGGQVLYPIIDEHWQLDLCKIDLIGQTLKKIANSGQKVDISIYLGGYLVLAGDESGLKILMEELPLIEGRFPLRLNKHAAFHTELMQGMSDTGFKTLPMHIFEHPTIPLVDGRGHIWQPYSTSLDELYEYTLGHQVTKAYDFTTAIGVCLKEFAPDKLVLLGPGTSLAGAIGQCMVKEQWLGIKSKKDFQHQQATKPFLSCLGDAT